MADRPRPPRLIPNWQMSKPWSAPMSPADQVALGMSALLSGASENENSILALFSDFQGLYVANLTKAQG